MGTINLNSVCSPSSLSAHANVVGDIKPTLSSMPENMKVCTGSQGSSRATADSSGLNNKSFNSIEDDSSHTTMTDKSSVNNDSDSDTIATNSSKSTYDSNDSLFPCVCTSGGASLISDKVRKSKVDHINESDPDNVDKLLVEELQELSVVDRGMVQEEIHGVSTCAISEDDAQVVESLKCLEEEIRKIRREVLASPEQVSKTGNTYNNSIWSYLAIDDETTPSIRLSYSYIFHQDFRLKFLRADLHDAEKAAHRYLRCIEGLLKYFGDYGLQRPLVFEDLGREGQDAAKEGCIQVLPTRDRAGRLIVVSQAPNPGTTMATFVKLFTYVFQVVSEDTETQKRGVIFIFSSDDNGLDLISNSASRKEFTLYREGSPVRWSCTHFCLPENNPKMRIVRSIMMLAMSREERVRTRIHMDGFTTETLYTLMTFGIPVSELPITCTGVIKTKHHHQWIKTRKAIDAYRMKSLEECYIIIKQQQEQCQSMTSQQFLCDFFNCPPTYDQFLNHHGKEPVIHPMTNDVLFSKGGKNVTHFGNIEFTDFLKHALSQYASRRHVTNRKMRKAIRQSIVDKVRARGGRFLTLDRHLPGGRCWTEIEKEPDLHDRVATSLYDHKRRLASKKKLKSIRSETAIFAAIDNTKRRKVVTDDGKLIPDDSFCGIQNI